MYQKHSHADGQPFRPEEEYLAATRCWACKASPGNPCVPPKGNGRPHLKRQDAARNWEGRDIGAAPYAEDREPGVCYSTLPGCE